MIKQTAVFRYQLRPIDSKNTSVAGDWMTVEFRRALLNPNSSPPDSLHRTSEGSMLKDINPS